MNKDQTLPSSILAAFETAGLEGAFLRDADTARSGMAGSPARGEANVPSLRGSLGGARSPASIGTVGATGAGAARGLGWGTLDAFGGCALNGLSMSDVHQERAYKRSSTPCPENVAYSLSTDIQETEFIGCRRRSMTFELMLDNRAMAS